MGEIALRVVEKRMGVWGEPGDMWPFGEGEWWIVLPWCTRGDHGSSWRTTDEAHDGSGRWTVTGTAPLLTVTPSIDVLHFTTRPNSLGQMETVRDGSCWHGWIRDGKLVSA